MSNYILKIFYVLQLLLLLTSGSTHEFKNTTIESVESKCIEREKQALLKFKQSIVDDFYMLSTWKDDNKDGDCCKWKRIECNNETGHVKKLDLRGADTQFLVGSIDFTSLIVLQNMEYLDLSYNSFHDNYISENIGSLTKLKYLNLSNSYVGGRIPYQIGKLLELEYLDLRDNKNIVGEIPSQLGNLTRLRYLNLRDNKNIVGEIPCQLRNLSQLQYLDLEGTSLSGAIPFQPGNLPVLQTLKLVVYFDLTNDNINWFSTLSSLTSLYLRGQFRSFVSSHYLLQTIMKFIPNLRELRLVDFGLIDTDFASLFHSHSNFSNSLTILDFSSNMLTSSTFQFLSNISLNLQELRLSENNIVLSSHYYPNFPSLVILDLSNNNISSSQFPGIRSFSSKLQELYLTNCMLTDKSFLVSSTSVVNSSSSFLILDLSSNMLRSSQIFLWAFNFTTTLHSLYLDGNLLEGPIPDGFEKVMNSLECLSLSKNNLQGDIPSFFSNMCTLHTLYLSNNNLSGEISSFINKNSVCNRHIFTDLDFSHNRITGALPECINLLSELEYLYLEGNSLEGEINDLHLTNFSKLKVLSLSYNSLSLKFPLSWVPPFKLIALNLASCKLGSSFPSWLQTQSSIRQIYSTRDVNPKLTQSSFCLSEGIPTCLENFTSLSEKSINTSETESQIYSTSQGYVYIHGVNFNDYTFNVPLFWKGMERGFKHPEMRLKGIDLSSNNLTGEIPKEIGYLVGLVSLNLSRNNLSGEIQSEIGNLVSLDFLDLSRNHFFGKIPSTLSNIDRLEILDLSNNSLSGRIPFGRQLQTLDPSGFEGNLDLCGEPLEKKCPEDATTINPPGSEIHGEDDNSVFHEGFYMCLGIGYFTGFWGLLGPILLWRSWRIAYIRFLNKLIDYIYVLVAVNVTRFQMWLKD